MIGNASLTLGQFQSAFAGALLRPTDDAARSPLSDLLAQPAFAVYRNTVMKGCIDALEANFPSVARLVGSDWFRAAAALHVAEAPPHDPRLLFYGARFPQFLRSFAPAAELPYLAGVAELDALWCTAHAAADAPTLAADALARMPAEALGTTVLTPHPATRWVWFDAQPIYSIWRRNRPTGAATHGDAEVADPAEIDWRGEGALLSRFDGAVVWQPASRADCAFLDACAAGDTLLDAAGAAAAIEPSADIAGLLAGLLRADAFRQPDATIPHRADASGTPT